MIALDCSTLPTWDVDYCCAPCHTAAAGAAGTFRAMRVSWGATAPAVVAGVVPAAGSYRTCCTSSRHAETALLAIVTALGDELGAPPAPDLDPPAPAFPAAPVVEAPTGPPPLDPIVTEHYRPADSPLPPLSPATLPPVPAP